MINVNFLGRRSWPSFKSCFFLATSLAALTACNDTTTGVQPIRPQVYVCQTLGTGPFTTTITNIPLADLASYKSRGAYVAELSVDKNNTPGDSIHFKTITEALAVARATRVAKNETEGAVCRITINVASGTYNGSTAPSADPLFERFPIVIDVPKISIIGAFNMGVDAQGRATGVGTTGDGTIIAPVPALIVPGTGSTTAASEEIFIVNSRVTGSKGNDALIEGFVLRSGHAAAETVRGGQGVLSLRVQNLTIRGNKFEGNFTERIDLRASSSVIERNHTSGIGATCDVCLAGPGTFVVRDNRIMEGGGIPGILSVPAQLLPVPALIEQYTLPDQSAVTVTVTNNEVRGHQASPVGVGIRFATMGVFAPNVVGSTTAVVTGNSLVNNRFGMILEAGFPVTGGSLYGDLDFTASGNTFAGSCQTDLFVSFTRHTTALGGNTNPYLKNSTYKLTLGTDIPFASAWYANPAGNGNTLIVNGTTITNGINLFYDAARSCSGTTGADTSAKIIEQTTTINSGDNQTATVGTVLPNLLRVLVRTGTVPRVGVLVQWTTATGTITATSLTDATGIATAQWTLGTKSGAQSATATVPSPTPVSVPFSATAQTAAAISIAKVGVHSQRAVLGMGTFDALRTSILDRVGNAVVDKGDAHIRAALADGRNVVFTVTAF